ncbi:MAG: PLP-dependent aminotransferase family protein [Mailhella sp.]|nr:PLP-dependent aminotransferase family protein [Mailhella sp.]
MAAVTGRGTFISTERHEAMRPPSDEGEPGWIGGMGGQAVPGRTDLGFIAHFNHLDPPLHEALSGVMERIGPKATAGLQMSREPSGMERHREAGAQWARLYGVHVDARDLIISAGAQHALLVTLMSLCAPGDRIAAESLSYPLIRHLAWRLRLGLVPVRTDMWGMLPDALESACRSGGVKAVYLMPSCRNPTLTHIPERRRRELVGICRRYDVLIIEDDAYALTADSPTVPFAGLAPERTCFIASTSEILGGGLRVAYLCPPQALLGELERTVSYSVSMVPPLMAEIAAQMIGDGTAARVLHAKLEEAARRNAEARAILGGIPLVTLRNGFFCWLPLPESLPAARFAADAAERGVIVAECGHFMMGHSPQENGVRIALGAGDGSDVAGALQRLRGLLAE